MKEKNKMIKDKKIPQRKDVSQEDQWDLAAIFKSGAEWETAFELLNNEIAGLKKFKGFLGKKEKTFACLEACFGLFRRFEKLYMYAHLKRDQDLSESSGLARMGRVEKTDADLSEASAFIESELARQSNDFFINIFADVKFKDYHFFLKKILRAKQHILSESEEELLAKLSEVLGVSEKIFQSISDSDFVFPAVKKGSKKIELTHGSYGRLIQDANREVRKQAMANMCGTYSRFRTSLAQSLYSHVKEKVVLAGVRKYPSVIESFLFDKALPSDVYKTLFSITEKGLPLLHRYGDIRKRVLGLNELHWYDLYVPLMKNVKEEYSYKQAVDLVLSSLGILGSEYNKIAVKALLEERWVDKYENKGKRSGAYSSGGYDTHAYILMNYNGTLNNVFTLAHELGHSMHSTLASLIQPFSNYRYKIFLAEIASTFNENLLASSLLMVADRKMKIFLINQELEKIRTTFFRQTMFAEFEEMIYDYVEKGGVLTADFLENEYFKLNQKYYGKNVIIDEPIKSEWSRIPHFYYNFYVYQYATGLACASYFSDKVLRGGEEERKNYLDLLSAGGSDFPAELLKKAGLDVSKPDYLEALMSKFKNLLDEFEEFAF